MVFPVVLEKFSPKTTAASSYTAVRGPTATNVRKKLRPFTLAPLEISIWRLALRERIQHDVYADVGVYSRRL